MYIEREFVARFGDQQRVADLHALVQGLRPAARARLLQDADEIGVGLCMWSAQRVLPNQLVWQVHIDMRTGGVRRQRAAVRALDLEAQDVFGFDAALDDPD